MLSGERHPPFPDRGSHCYGAWELVDRLEDAELRAQAEADKRSRQRQAERTGRVWRRAIRRAVSTRRACVAGRKHFRPAGSMVIPDTPTPYARSAGVDLEAGGCRVAAGVN